MLHTEPNGMVEAKRYGSTEALRSGCRGRMYNMLAALASRGMDAKVISIPDLAFCRFQARSAQYG